MITFISRLRTIIISFLGKKLNRLYLRERKSTEKHADEVLSKYNFITMTYFIRKLDQRKGDTKCL